MTYEKGFTLIELMIVVAIIGVLAAIAIPQYSSFRVKSFNAAASSDLKNFTTAISVFSPYPDPISATFPGTLTISNGVDTRTLPLSKGVTLSMLQATATPTMRCIFSKHIAGDSIMYANSENMSVIKYVSNSDDIGSALGSASTYAAAQAAACNI